ncbi:oligosaccharide flippase family protein [Ornithinibacillus massiliensis]|uniref:Oligosaccharide flippase family protein n=1 Tax=Ornithinibacillus massiliensis TaxID=1944633 RepID=A0ABS5MHS3_9BACI|nr:oligosaccharide flippase family protein [Ornithinibacillus massiliensis]
MIIEKLPLWKNMSWTVVGNIYYSLSQWFMLIILAKLGTPELMGIYMLGLAITAPIIFFFEMDLRVILVTDVKHSVEFSHYLGTRMISLLFAILTICLLAILFNYTLLTMCIIIIIGLAKVSESISDIIHGQLQRYERMDFISISHIIKGTLTLLIFFLLLFFTGNLAMALIGQVITWFSILFLFDRVVLKRYISMKPKFKVPIMKSLLTIGFPLGIVTLLATLNTNLPLYFVEYFLGKEVLGFFGALLYLLFAGNRFVNALRQPTIPILSNLFEQKALKAFNRFMIKLVVVGVGIGIVGVLLAYFLGEWILTMLYSAEYTSYKEEFVLVMVAGVFLYPLMFLDAAVDSARYFKIQPYLTLLWIISSVIIGELLIPNYGIIGAVYVVLLSSIIQFFTYVIVYSYILVKAKRVDKVEGVHPHREVVPEMKHVP